MAVLIALEAIRPSWPALQAFYLRYLDPSKDGTQRITEPHETTKPDKHFLIVSHTALILGCAMPLWCYLMSDARISPFFPFGGILVLGIGDALAAVVGKWYGHHRWYAYVPHLSKENKRTVEGSVAMYVGQLLFVGVLETWGIPIQWFVIVPSVLFVSVLEAWTTQMDNIMIPLALVAFMGLWDELALSW
jgi:dolichol kinase